jgi:hypothetical protein
LLNQKLAAAEKIRQDEATALKKSLEEAANAQKTAEELQKTLQAQLTQAEKDGAAAIETAKTEAKRVLP